MVKYIVRLDDACPTMNWKKWERVFSILDLNNIKPIVAVIPNNQDFGLKIDKPNNEFWHLVRRWQSNGYHIAMHGYNHVYTSKNKGLVPFNSRSEFAGIEKVIQKEKISKSWEIFIMNKIYPKIWVAPAHSFDNITLEVIKEETDIRIVSDGLSIFPYKKNGFIWIPQQLWNPIKKQKGVWTICLHPNNMSDKHFNDLDSFIKNNKENFKFNLDDVIKRYQKRKKSIVDVFYSEWFLLIKNIKKFIKKILKALFNYPIK